MVGTPFCTAQLDDDDAKAPNGSGLAALDCSIFALLIVPYFGVCQIRGGGKNAGG